jgi:signal transduction histidine kinase
MRAADARFCSAAFHNLITYGPVPRGVCNFKVLCYQGTENLLQPQHPLDRYHQSQLVFRAALPQEQRPAIIRLHACPQPGFVKLTVQDNGLGIDLVKNRAKLFGMYKTFHDNEDARGVGLFLTKNQIEAMLGSIEVESEVGVGSTFKIYFNENA